MKKMRNVWIPMASVCMLLASCAEDYKETIPMPEKPVDTALSERLASYGVLKEYAAKAGLNLGAAVNPDDLAAQELVYSIIKTNFSQVESSVSMTPTAFLNAESEYDFATLSTLLEAAEKGELNVFGPALCSDVNIPAYYLKSQIADVVIPYQPWSEDIMIADFEDKAIDTAYPSSKKDAGSSDVKVIADPLGQQGNVLCGTKLTMDLPMIAEVKLPDGFTIADVSRVKLKCLLISGTPTSSRIQIESAGYNEKGNPYKSTGQWEDYIFDLSKLKLKDAELAKNTVKIAVGAYGSNVTCCIDEVKVQLEHAKGDDTVISKTPEEKAEIINGELYRWVDGVAGLCGERVKDYIIFDEPLDSETANFHWSDWLGDGYVSQVQKAVDAKAGGNTRYFVSQTLTMSNMFADDIALLKTEIDKLESRGVRVDAVNIVLDVTYNQDYSAQTAIDAMTEAGIKSLKNLGKPVRIAGLKVKVVDVNGMQANPVNMTVAQRQAIGEYYELIIKTFLQELGENAMSLSFSSAVDNTLEVGLWQQNGNRSFVYEGVVRGLTK